MHTAEFESTHSSKLNSVQLHLLELFSKEMTEQELSDIKELLTQYYARKVEEEMNSIWERKGYSQATFAEATEKLHLRAKSKP